jgi:regulator of PEP synthase PpsR (kinase-PPPase family)
MSATSGETPKPEPVREETSEPHVLILTDVVDDSLERVVRVAQASRGYHRWVLKMGIASPAEIDVCAEENAPLALIFFYFHKRVLVERVREVADRAGVVALNIFDPILKTIEYAIHEGIARPATTPTRLNYFDKVDAIEFAAKHDDGRNPHELKEADLVLIGVSRTSKTPLALYLANYGLKVANVPIVFNIAPPDELFKIPRRKIVGLTISPTRLYKIRVNRRANIGVESWRYASLESVSNEVEYAEDIMKQLGCPIIDVTQKAIEETADEIFKIMGWEEKNGR